MRRSAVPHYTRGKWVAATGRVREASRGYVGAAPAGPGRPPSVDYSVLPAILRPIALERSYVPYPLPKVLPDATEYDTATKNPTTLTTTTRGTWKGFPA